MSVGGASDVLVPFAHMPEAAPVRAFAPHVTAVSGSLPQDRAAGALVGETGHHDVNLLLVEDNPGDIRLTREALSEGMILNRLHVVHDGEEAMDFLHRRGHFVGSPRPDIVLLDLNLPRKDGREVLAELKSDPDLRRIPVIVLTTSSTAEDVLRSYELHANCFITKPINYGDFIAAVQSIGSFWLKIVRLPPE